MSPRAAAFARAMRLPPIAAPTPPSPRGMPAIVGDVHGPDARGARAGMHELKPHGRDVHAVRAGPVAACDMRARPRGHLRSHDGLHARGGSAGGGAG